MSRVEKVYAYIMNPKRQGVSVLHPSMCMMPNTDSIFVVPDIKNDVKEMFVESFDAHDYAKILNTNAFYLKIPFKNKRYVVNYMYQGTKVHSTIYNYDIGSTFLNLFLLDFIDKGDVVYKTNVSSLTELPYSTNYDNSYSYKVEVELLYEKNSNTEYYIKATHFWSDNKDTNALFTKLFYGKAGEPFSLPSVSNVNTDIFSLSFRNNANILPETFSEYDNVFTTYFDITADQNKCCIVYNANDEYDNLIEFSFYYGEENEPYDLSGDRYFGYQKYRNTQINSVYSGVYEKGYLCIFSRYEKM